MPEKICKSPFSPPPGLPAQVGFSSAKPNDFGRQADHDAVLSIFVNVGFGSSTQPARLEPKWKIYRKID
jgi:hypothetical protein